LGYNRIGDLDIAEIQGLYIDGEYTFRDVCLFLALFF
jgi:hypothetical protein